MSGIFLRALGGENPKAFFLGAKRIYEQALKQGASLIVSSKSMALTSP